MRISFLLLLAALGFASVPAQAQPPSPQPPACSAETAGTLACFAGTSCECRFERGGSITGQPEGYRWDCSILRPSCPGSRPPADIRATERNWIIAPDITVPDYHSFKP